MNVSGDHYSASSTIHPRFPGTVPLNAYCPDEILIIIKASFILKSVSISNDMNTLLNEGFSTFFIL